MVSFTLLSLYPWKENPDNLSWVSPTDDLYVLEQRKYLGPAGIRTPDRLEEQHAVLCVTGVRSRQFFARLSASIRRAALEMHTKKTHGDFSLLPGCKRNWNISTCFNNAYNIFH